MWRQILKETIQGVAAMGLACLDGESVMRECLDAPDREPQHRKPGFRI